MERMMDEDWSFNKLDTLLPTMEIQRELTHE